MMDLTKLRHEAQFAAGSPDQQTAYLAHALLHILDNPRLVVPQGWRLVPEPELRGKGVPSRVGY